MEDKNVNLFFKTEETTEQIEWEAVSFVDFLKLANEAWLKGGGFDINQNILSIADTSSPVRILQRDKFRNSNPTLYVVWGSLVVHDSPFEIPVRFFAVPDSYKQAAFKWTINETVRSIDLTGYIDYVEELENSKWGALLGE